MAVTLQAFQTLKQKTKILMFQLAEAASPSLSGSLEPSTCRQLMHTNTPGAHSANPELTYINWRCGAPTSRNDCSRGGWQRGQHWDGPGELGGHMGFAFGGGYETRGQNHGRLVPLPCSVNQMHGLKVARKVEGNWLSSSVLTVILRKIFYIYLFHSGTVSQTICATYM